MSLSQVAVGNDIRCVVCNGDTQRINLPDLIDIKAKLAVLLGNDDVLAIPLPSYQMNRCNSCALEFSNPMTPGSNLFYEWVSSNSNYYPKERWEWSVVIDELNKGKIQNNSKQNLLDVGCGSGSFLDQIRNKTQARGVGVDFTEASIRACLAQGVEAFCCDIAGLKNHFNERFHVVTLFHVIEHVPDPVLLLEEVMDVLEANGSIFVSTPYSPMSIEENWFDPLNHPPHHLTRWNIDAYKQLGKRLDLGVRFHVPIAVSLLRRTFNSLRVQQISPFIKISRFAKILRFLKFCTFNPATVLKEIKTQYRRRSILGAAAPDSILVEFHRK